MEHHFGELDDHVVLKVSPAWTWAVFWLCLALLLGTALFAIFARVEVNERVPGIVLASGSSMAVTAQLAGRHRAVINEGDRVRLDLDDYPYAEFGALEGRIVRIEPDMPGGHLRLDIAVLAPQGGPLAGVELRAGMRANVQITLRRQRLVSYALDPLRRWAQ